MLELTLHSELQYFNIWHPEQVSKSFDLQKQLVKVKNFFHYETLYCQNNNSWHLEQYWLISVQVDDGCNSFLLLQGEVTVD